MISGPLPFLPMIPISKCVVALMVFALLLQVESLGTDAGPAIHAGIQYALKEGLAVDGVKAVVVRGEDVPAADKSPVLTVENLGELTCISMQYG